ncbi:MAG: hypothetical protein KGM18_12400 [Sphingomonadales bacterium]|nr:hypothetical protein [Sphingomonadales bacterium]
MPTVSTTSPTIQLADGAATNMGDGVFALTQKDEHGFAHSVVVTEEDLRALVASLAEPVGR